jgi:hypothetical protein
LEIVWTVDARKLKGNDKLAVSPPFNLPLGPANPSVTFKMIIHPKKCAESKGGESFKKSDGVGTVMLKCEGDIARETVARVRFKIALGSGIARASHKLVWRPKEWVHHDFARSALCGLPKSDCDFWFASAQDDDSMTFNVHLDLQPL